MATKIAVLGSGIVGEVLANGLIDHGYIVMRGSREPDKLAGWRAKAGPSAEVGTVEAAAAWGETIVLAVKGSAAEAVIDAVAKDLTDKTVIDTTNPIADAPPENGVLRYFTTHDESLMERLQKRAPAARFVKAFSQVSNTRMIDPTYAGGERPTMFICGDHAGAKEEVSRILQQVGWDAADFGGVQSARAIEPLCMLYCIRGFMNNQWTHAFKLLES